MIGSKVAGSEGHGCRRHSRCGLHAPAGNLPLRVVRCVRQVHRAQRHGLPTPQRLSPCCLQLADLPVRPEAIPRVQEQASCLPGWNTNGDPIDSKLSFEQEVTLHNLTKLRIEAELEPARYDDRSSFGNGTFRVDDTPNHAARSPSRHRAGWRDAQGQRVTARSHPERRVEPLARRFDACAGSSDRRTSDRWW